MPPFMFYGNKSYYFVKTPLYIHVDKHTFHLTDEKIDHPKMARICLSSKRDSIFELVYLQQFSSELEWSRCQNLSS